MLIHLSKTRANPEEFVIVAQKALNVPVRAAFSGLRVEL